MNWAASWLMRIFNSFWEVLIEQARATMLSWCDTPCLVYFLASNESCQRHNFSKVRSVATLYSKLSRELTFENLAWQQCHCHPPSSSCAKFSKVFVRLHLLYKASAELTFEKFVAVALVACCTKFSKTSLRLDLLFRVTIKLTFWEIVPFARLFRAHLVPQEQCAV